MLLTRRSLFAAAAAPFVRGSVPPLKITKFVIHKATLRWRDLVFLEIQTDSGLTGIGEATLETKADAVEEALRWLESDLAGRDPGGIEEHWNRIYYGLSRWRSGPATLTALSAVDIALWDLEGRRLGLPVWRLLGGKLRPAMRAYYTHWSATLRERSASEFRDHAIRTRDAGWTAVKWTVPSAGTERERIAKTVAEVDAVRSATGRALDIGLECAEVFTIRSALQLARELEPYHLLFLEEPVLRENPAGLGEVASKSRIPIATGEGLFSRFEFRQLLEARGALIIQPDVLHAGGITELRKIANLAETYGVEIAPHQCSGPVAHVASLAAMSVCRNFVLQEWEAEDDKVFTELTGGAYPVQQNGAVGLSDAPGLGLTVDFGELAKRFPFKATNRRALLG